LPNNLQKSGLDHVPSDAHYKLYRSWAEGGVGLILSGNVMIDRRALTGPGAVILENDAQLDRFREWARVGRSNGGQFWLQINHPGRQVLAALGQQTVAPSAVPLELGALSRMFPVPREMTEHNINDVVKRL
jgi:2,4-dienoyl-CoA reductase-like NADH-dependent reductase (Old Yellow Enzyme family)